MKCKGMNRAILLGVVSILFFAGGIYAETPNTQGVLQEDFSWYGESGAMRAPVYDRVMPGLWWMPDNAPSGEENTRWGNRGYVFVGMQKPVPPVYEAAVVAPEKEIVYVDKPVEKIVYVDKPVEKIVYVDKPVEKIVYVDRPVEKIVYVDRPVEKVKTIRLTDVFFDYDRSSLTPLGEKTLRDNMEVLKANPEVKVLLIGSASPEGTNDYNQKLSQRRVNAVSTWLLNNGISQSRFLSDAIGEIEVIKSEWPSVRKVQVNVTENVKK